MNLDSFSRGRDFRPWVSSPGGHMLRTIVGFTGLMKAISGGKSHGRYNPTSSQLVGNDLYCRFTSMMISSSPWPRPNVLAFWASVRSLSKRQKCPVLVSWKSFRCHSRRRCWGPYLRGEALLQLRASRAPWNTSVEEAICVAHVIETQEQMNTRLYL